MDIALVLDYLLPETQYGGSLTENTREAYGSIRWEDPRPKPVWDEIISAWPTVEAHYNHLEEEALAKIELRETDRYMLLDSPYAVGSPDWEIVKTYRQQLREVVRGDRPVRPEPIQQVPEREKIEERR